MPAGWGPWQDGIEYWSTVSAFSNQARWHWYGDTAETLRDDALAAAEWAKAISGSEVEKESGGFPGDVTAVSQITYSGYDGVNEHYHYQSGAYRGAFGTDATGSRYNPPPLDWPPGASDHEYEVVDEDGNVFSDFLGEAKLNLLDYYFESSSTGSPMVAQLDLRVLDVALADLAISDLAYDPSGATVWSTGEVGSYGSHIAGPTTVDISAYVDPGDGKLVIVTVLGATGWTAPPGQEYEGPPDYDWYRAVSGDLYAEVEYKCLTPRFRWWYDELPPEPEITPVTVVRQYPRDDQYGLGSAPRLHPPPSRGRVVGGLQ